MGKDDHKIIGAEGDPSSSSKNTDTETASQKRGRGRPRKDGSTSGGSKTVADLPRLVLVEDPNEDDEQPADPKSPAAPKKSSSKKRKDVQYEFKKEQLAVLIKSTFDIIGSREGLEIWKLSQKESETIADPLCGLMAKNPFLDRITSEYGDWIALVVALGTIIVPRAFVMWAAKPKKKEVVKPYVTIEKPNEKPRGNAPQPVDRGDKGRAAGDSNKQPSRESTAARGNIGTQLYDLVPAIQ
jgi:hypothetical protein